MFKLEDIKAGYVLEILEGDTKELVMVCQTPSGTLCISGANIWCDLSEFNEELTYASSKIVKIYSHSASNRDAHKVSTYRRDLLWERKKLIEEQKLIVFLEDYCKNNRCKEICSICRAKAILKHYDIKEKK